MNNERDEQAMWNEAAHMRQQSEVDLQYSGVMQAVQRGLIEGQRREKKAWRTKSTVFGLAAAAVIAFLLYIVPDIPSSPRTAGLPEDTDWGVLEPFKRFESIDTDGETFNSVMRNDYIQLVNKSAESQGYKITLNAVTADENKIIFLYTAETDKNQEIYHVNSAKLLHASLDGDFQYSGGIGAHPKVQDQDNYHKWYGRSFVMLDRNKPFPDQLVAEFQIASVDSGKMDDPKTGTIMADMHYSPNLKISFTLDNKFKETATRVVHPNTTFMLGGHEVVLTEVEMSPLVISARVALKNPSENQWEVRQKIMDSSNYTANILSVTNTGWHKLQIMSGEGTDDGFIKKFSSNMLDDPRSLHLVFETMPGSGTEEIRIGILQKNRTSIDNDYQLE